MSVRYYGLSAYSSNANLTNAHDLTLTGGGSGITDSTGTETFNFNGFFMELAARGGSMPARGSIVAGQGHGLIFNSTSLEGTTIPSGTWTFSVPMKNSNASGNVDLTAIAMLVHDSTLAYTEICRATLTSQTVGTSSTTFTFTATGVASQAFTTGDKLYIELWYGANSGGSGTNLTSYSVSSTSSGDATGFYVDTPGGATTSTRNVPSSASTSATNVIRAVPSTAAIATGPSRTVPTSAATRATNVTRVVTTSAAIIGAIPSTKPYYGLSTDTLNLNNSLGLTGTGGGVSTTQSVGTQTYNYGGSIELYTSGGASTLRGSPGPASGRGFVLDTTEFAGTTVPAGTWSVSLPLVNSDSTANVDLVVRAYKLQYSDFSFTAIGSATVAAVNVTTTPTTFTFNMPGISAVSFVTGEHLYFDVYYQLHSGGSATNLTSFVVSSTSSGALGGVHIDVPIAGSTTSTRNVPSTASLSSSSGIRNVSMTAAIVLGGNNRSIPASGAISASNVRRSIPMTATMGGPPQNVLPMPVISRGVPAYASNEAFYAASNANDGVYNTMWRSVTDPSVASPHWLSYDLSGVPVNQRKQVVLALYNTSTGTYWQTLGSGIFYSQPKDYTVQANAAAGGGTSPTAGWVTLATVTSNTYSARMHDLDLTGYNWVRVLITASNGAAGVTDIAIQMDVHDASQTHNDTWLFLGDSITSEGSGQRNLDQSAWNGGYISQLVSTATGGQHFPMLLDGGIGGQTMSWAATNIAPLLAPFTGKYVTVAYGTNDANQNVALPDSQITGYYAALLTVIDAIVAQNAIPVVPYIPWGSNNAGMLGVNAQTLNAYVDAHLPIDRPIALRGPDMWTLFNNNQSLIRDGIHPTYLEANAQLSGYEIWQRAWRDSMLALVYTSGARTIPSTAAIDFATPFRIMPLSASTSSRNVTRAVPTSASAFRYRLIPMSAATTLSFARSVPTTASLAGAAIRIVHMSAAVTTSSQTRVVPASAAIYALPPVYHPAASTLAATYNTASPTIPIYPAFILNDTYYLPTRSAESYPPPTSGVWPSGEVLTFVFPGLAVSEQAYIQSLTGTSGKLSIWTGTIWIRCHCTFVFTSATLTLEVTLTTDGRILKHPFPPDIYGL